MKFVPRPLLSSPCIEEGFKQKAWKVQISERNLPFSQGELFSEEIRKSILYSQYNAFRSFSFFRINQVSLERVQRSCHCVRMAYIKHAVESLI